MIHLESPVRVAIFPSKDMAHLAVTKGRPDLRCLAKPSMRSLARWAEDFVDCQLVTWMPAARSCSKPRPATCGIGVAGGADDAFDSGVDYCLCCREMWWSRCLVRLEGAVDGAALGGVAGVVDGDGFGVGSGIGLGCAFADDGFTVGSDDDGADWWSGS